jgi:alcohol dehydrogenase class IV
LKPEDMEEVVGKATKASSMKANPLVLHHEELAQLFKAAL